MEMLALSQSSLLLPLPKLRLGSRFHTKITSTSTSSSTSLLFSRVDFPSSSVIISRVKPGLTVGVVSDSKSPVVIIESAAEAVGVEGFDVRLDSTGGDGFDGGDSGNGDGGGGGGGGGDNNDDNNKNEGEGEGESDGSNSKKIGMSMSQKLTLGYAALIGLGGVMGYLKSGSQKSLLAGGLSASLLFYVYSELPVRPTFASSIGLGLSAALLVVMGSRFKKSGKIFPAGVVSLVSFVMTGGYLHGIMRGMH